MNAPRSDAPHTAAQARGSTIELGHGLCLYWGWPDDELPSPQDAPEGSAELLRSAFIIASCAAEGSRSSVFTPGASFPFLHLTRDAMESAMAAPRPFPRAWMPEISDPAQPTEEWSMLVARLLEGLRLIGPPPAAEPHPMARAVGPMLSTPKVVEATQTSRQNLAAQAKNRRLIRLTSRQRTQWWPTLQFRRAGDRIVADPGVQALWGALPTGTVSDWDHAVWLCSARDDLDGDAPLDLATDVGAIDREPLRGVLHAYVDRLVR
jgi:hypothetical protein